MANQEALMSDYRRPSRPSRTSVHIIDDRRPSQQHQPRGSTTAPPWNLSSVSERVQRPSVSTQPGRRQSIWMRRPSVAGSHRMWSEDRLPVAVGGQQIAYENTYQLEPNEDQTFYPSKVEPIIAQILESFLDSEVYEASKCSALVRNVSDVIKARMKGLGFTRHKIVCFVVIGEKAGQTLRSASRCLWDKENDGFASVHYSNSTLVATATVYAVYFD